MANKATKKVIKNRDPLGIQKQIDKTIFEFKELVEKSTNTIVKLEKTVQKSIKPSPGPYAFFNHASQIQERIKDINIIIERLLRNKVKAINGNIKLDKIIPKDWPALKLYPDKAQQIFKEVRQLDEKLKFDMETLYIYSLILLDQWAILALYISGMEVNKLQKKYNYPFNKLVVALDNQDQELKILFSIWKKHKEDMIWLDSQVRIYRNQLIIHSTRPWQRGTNSRVYYLEFNLFTPSPPGWLDDKKITKEIMTLLPFASRIKNASKDYWERKSPRAIMENAFDNIGKVDNIRDREKIIKLFSLYGGSTPTFQKIGKKVLNFIWMSTLDLNKIAIKNIKSVNIGKSKN